jgi:hypothetical protein
MTSVRCRSVHKGNHNGWILSLWVHVKPSKPLHIYIYKSESGWLGLFVCVVVCMLLGDGGLLLCSGVFSLGSVLGATKSFIYITVTMQRGAFWVLNFWWGIFLYVQPIRRMRQVWKDNGKMGVRGIDNGDVNWIELAQDEVQYKFWSQWCWIVVWYYHEDCQ